MICAYEDKHVTAIFWEPRLSELYIYWDSIKKDPVTGRTAQTDFDLSAIGHLLPIINIIDVSWKPLQFRHRSVGNDIIIQMGRDVSGKVIEGDLYGFATQDVFNSLTLVAREARPYRRLAQLDWNGTEGVVLEALELPLVDDHQNVAVIIRASQITKQGSPLSQRLQYDPLP